MLAKLYDSAALDIGAHPLRGIEDWRARPVVDLQVLAKKLDRKESGKSRVVWYLDGRYRRLFYDVAFYAWLEDGPAGITPDAVLDLWYQETGQTDVRIADLSLDDLASIDVKCGRSIPDFRFNPILQLALNDAEIP